MMTGCPKVTFLKYAKSAGRCQGIWLLWPMMRFFAIATMREMRMIFGPAVVYIRRRSAL